MYCVQCGKKIPDGLKICQDCAKQQIEQQNLGKTQILSDRIAEPRIPTPEKQAKKPVNKLLIPLVLVSALLIGVCGFTIYSYRQVGVQKANYRAKEAALTSREKELTSLQSDYDTVCAELETAESTISEQKTTISSLESEITTLEGSASQNEYNITEMQKVLDQAEADIATLTTENESLTSANTTLTSEKETLAGALKEKEDAITSLEDELTAVTSDYNTAKTKSDFIDRYVVFVNNDGTDYYHKYDCSSFKKSNFWAYSPKLAENYGYEACPDCCD